MAIPIPHLDPLLSGELYMCGKINDNLKRRLSYLLQDRPPFSLLIALWHAHF